MKRLRLRGQRNRNPRGGDRGGVGPSSVGGPVQGASGQGNPGDSVEAERESDANPPPFKNESTSAGSSSVSPSKNANAEVGYSRVNYRLRSVLFHPFGLPLVSLFDDSPALREYVRKSFPQVHTRMPYASEEFDGVLLKSYQAFEKLVKNYDEEEQKKKRSGEPKITKPSEESLTKETHAQIALELDKSLEAKHQHSMYYHVSTKSKARTDILIKRNDDSDSTAIVLLLEVALGKKPEWWLKADQNVSYLQNFLKDMNKESTVKFTGPVMFAVLTVKTTNGLDDVSFRSAHLGVFLCVPATASRTCRDFRMALIWREMFESLDNASKGMGKTLRAASALAGIVANQGSMGFHDFKYLGPNCCRIKDQVLRAYDTRFRPTSRRPDLYGDPEIAPGTQVVCRISDKNLAVATAAAAEAGFEASRQEEQLELNLQLRDKRRKVDESIAMQDWLWEFGGELLVIETNFHEGRHYALSPEEFIPVVAFLQKMHEKGYVHGDIRCANVVFNKCLIDFDLGGRLDDTPTYPDGYVRNLDDGARLGRGREPITKWHDWYALLKVMFELHLFHPPATKEDSAPDLSKSHRRFLALVGEVSLGDSEIQNLVDELIAFLKDAESWTVTFSGNFRRELESWGVLAREQAPRKTSHPATGSPQEQKR